MRRSPPVCREETYFPEGIFYPAPGWYSSPAAFLPYLFLHPRCPPHRISGHMDLVWALAYSCYCCRPFPIRTPPPSACCRTSYGQNEAGSRNRNRAGFASRSAVAPASPTVLRTVDSPYNYLHSCCIHIRRSPAGILFYSQEHYL